MSCRAFQIYDDDPEYQSTTAFSSIPPPRMAPPRSNHQQQSSQGQRDSRKRPYEDEDPRQNPRPANGEGEGKVGDAVVKFDWLSAKDGVFMETPEDDLVLTMGKVQLPDYDLHCLTPIVQSLHTSLRKALALPAASYHRSRSLANPHELAGRHDHLVNRSAVKLAALDRMMQSCPGQRNGRGLVRMGGGGGVGGGEVPTMTFLDVCAGPGGFVEYLLWRARPRRGSRDVKGWGMTLKGIQDFDVDKFNHAARGAAKEGCFEAVYGPDGTGGDFLVKSFDLFTPYSASLLYLLRRVFLHLAIAKPLASRPANSERYILCRMFRGRGHPSVRLVAHHLETALRRLNEVMAGDTEGVSKEVTSHDGTLWDFVAVGERIARGDEDVVEVVSRESVEKDEALMDFLQNSNMKLCLRQTDALGMISKFATENPEKSPYNQELTRILCHQFPAAKINVGKQNYFHTKETNDSVRVGERNEITMSVVKVANISALVNESLLRGLLSHIGEIASLTLTPSPYQDGSQECLVEFADPASASVAMHLTGTEFGDRMLLVTNGGRSTSLMRPAAPSPAPGTFPVTQAPFLGAKTLWNITPPLLIDPVKAEEIARTVYVGNITSLVSEEDLTQCFASCGPIAYLKMTGDPNVGARFAFIEFEAQADAKDLAVVPEADLGDDEEGHEPVRGLEGGMNGAVAQGLAHAADGHERARENAGAVGTGEAETERGTAIEKGT
ncbi:FtsJ methyltransferase domain-containing protein 2 [Phlyctochytrium bullatum]|nr:FtsJ methyltransferase domain-containing protein 2 [Phlyctochytrium bullatum]